jgi:putative tricarboxylic transport membrane protein
MARFLTLKNIFSLFLVVWFAYGVWEARSYAFLAKIFPFYVSLVLLLCAVISIVLEVRKIVDRADDLHDTSSGSDLSVDWDLPMSEVWRRFGLYIGIILAVYVFIYFIGYPLAMTVFICLFYRLIAKAKWTISLIAGCAGFGFLALASRVLGMEWPQGLLKLPWPFG